MVQYRVLNRILGTNKLRFAMQLAKSDQCRFCQSHKESLTHLFFLCEKTKSFYKDLSKFIENKLKFKIPLDILTVTLGYLIHNQHFEAVNTLFLLAKNYLFSCAYSGVLPNISEFKYYFQFIFNEQQKLARLNNKFEEFNKNLGRWRPLFE